MPLLTAGRLSAPATLPHPHVTRAPAGTSLYNELLRSCLPHQPRGRRAAPSSASLLGGDSDGSGDDEEDDGSGDEEDEVSEVRAHAWRLRACGDEAVPLGAGG